jgi:hypothetical protein
MFKFIFIIVFSYFLAACGSGGGSQGLGNSVVDSEEAQDSGSNSDDPDEIPTDDIEEPAESSLNVTVPFNISKTTTHSQFGSLAISSDNTIHVTWIDNGDVLYSQSTDNGVSFTSSEVIVPQTFTYQFDYSKITSTLGAIHITWTAYDNNNGAEIFYIRSIDGGESFSNPELLSLDDAYNSYGSEITSDGINRVGISWNNQGGGGGRSRFTISEDEGLTFSTPKTLINQGLSPLLYLTPSEIYSTWSSLVANDGNIFFSKSVDSGVSYSSPKNISQVALNERTWNGDMTADEDGTIYTVWESGTAGQTNVMLATSIDGGSSFSPPIVISESEVYSFCPSITSNGANKIYVAWSTDEDGFRTYIVESNDGGKSFSEKQQLTMISTDGGCPNISMNGPEHIRMIWQDTGLGVNELPDIFYSELELTLFQ